MQPRPMAETVRPWVPSLCVVNIGVRGQVSGNCGNGEWEKVSGISVRSTGNLIPSAARDLASDARFRKELLGLRCFP
jgi:hypothetical protein